MPHSGGHTSPNNGNSVNRKRQWHILIQNLYNLAGGQLLREQPTRMVGDTEARKNRTADMFGVVGAECPRTIDGDLAAVHIETPSDDLPLIDVADTLVGEEFV